MFVIEERHESRLGEVRWLVISSGHETRAAAEQAMARLNARFYRSRRVSERQA